jgi:hypothetical protein
MEGIIDMTVSSARVVVTTRDNIFKVFRGLILLIKSTNNRSID